MNCCTQLDDILMNMYLDNRTNPIEFQGKRSRLSMRLTVHTCLKELKLQIIEEILEKQVLVLV